MHIFVYPSSHVELFRFASLLIEQMQYQNLEPLFVRYKKS
jgi:hypothetical protein